MRGQSQFFINIGLELALSVVPQAGVPYCGVWAAIVAILASGRREDAMQGQPCGPTSARTLGMIGLGAALLALGFVAGRRSADPERAAVSSAAVPEIGAGAIAAAPPHRPRYKIERPFPVRPVELYEAKDAEGEQRYRTEQAANLFGLVRTYVKRANAFDANGDPETIANQAVVYVAGWTDAVVRLAPDLVDELAAEVQRVLCARGTSDAELIIVSGILMHMPELADAKAFDCVFSAHPREDAALWWALQAWRRSGLPKGAALAAIERSAKDERTLRLLSGELELPTTERTGAQPGPRFVDAEEAAVLARRHGRIGQIGTAPPIERTTDSP